MNNKSLYSDLHELIKKEKERKYRETFGDAVMTRDYSDYQVSLKKGDRIINKGPATCKVAKIVTITGKVAYIPHGYFKSSIENRFTFWENVLL